MTAGQLKLLLRMCREGGEYLPEYLQADLRQVEKTYQDLGFLRVQLETPDVQIRSVGDKKVAAIRIVVREGPRYSTGKVAARETKAISPGTLVQLCPLQARQPHSPRKTAEWQAKAEDAYRSMGYLRIRCPVRTTVNEVGKTVDCTMECEEGKIYTIEKITVIGAGGVVNPGELKRRLLFSEGGIFNPEMLFLSMQFLNQARLYQPISSSDVDVRIDDEKGTVDVSLRVLPLAR